MLMRTEEANSDVMQQRRMQLRDLESVHVMPSFSQFQSRMAILKVTIYGVNQGLVDCRVDRLVFRSFKAPPARGPKSHHH